MSTKQLKTIPNNAHRRIDHGGSVFSVDRESNKIKSVIKNEEKTVSHAIPLAGLGANKGRLRLKSGTEQQNHDQSLTKMRGEITYGPAGSRLSNHSINPTRRGRMRLARTLWRRPRRAGYAISVALDEVIESIMERLNVF